MNPIKKNKADNKNTRDIYRELAKERDIEFRQLRAGAASLFKTDVDCIDYMHRNPNDRIQFAVESGLFPTET